MHPRNIHNEGYDFASLIMSHQELQTYVEKNAFGNNSIDFSDNRAVLQLNKAILKHYYQITEWNIPEYYLCPAIPGRADYIHYIADLLKEEDDNLPIKGLDIGTGANCIYAILGAQIYGWHMVGSDIKLPSIAAAQANIEATKALKKKIKIRHQNDNAHIFEGIIKKDEYYHFTMCNPPFHKSEAEATKGTLRKTKNLEYKSSILNFGGQSNELWCNGGEALFIKRMIKQSINYKRQVGWFSSLVSKKENLAKLYKQLNKLPVVHKTIQMNQGNKKSRFIAWKFQ
ncbi:23S rRNA (adenine(1618)-N(6))-methyltransferase RlmF [Aquimarina addita]|uniref:Ribosomal RNA large subunit methyltransferase F n=1 Tax=Aquimarina addita TaxID=870485 RepID=A0ABP6USJ0_9FLAO